MCVFLGGRPITIKKKKEVLCLLSALLSFTLVSSFYFIRLVSFCLLSLMTTLEERISALEEEIQEYRVKLKDATTLEEKKMYADLITECRRNLTALLQQQLQLQGE